MAHGSLTDVETYVTGEPEAVRQLEELRRVDPRAGVLVLGHTHRPWLFDPAGGTLPATAGPERPFPETARFLVNPGSVGQSRQRERWPRARFLLLDLHRRRLRFFAEPYDAAATLDALRRHGLPRSCVHVPPGRLRAVPRRVATLLRHARR
jgi:diadenosine tetraphosphatase ApaH/serine/threonine PP2A family protein phosphatase